MLVEEILNEKSRLSHHWFFFIPKDFSDHLIENSFLYSSRPGADCGSDHELLITKFRLKLKKVGKTARPFRYHLNQIPYDYTVEVRNRIKGLDLIDRVPEELWTGGCDIYRRQRSRPSPRNGNAKKQNGCLGGLTNSCEKKRGEKQRRKGKI